MFKSGWGTTDVQVAGSGHRLPEEVHPGNELYCLKPLKSVAKNLNTALKDSLTPDTTGQIDDESV
jgi:hypothetical protein